MLFNSTCVTSCPYNVIPRLDINQCIINNCSSPLCLLCPIQIYICTSCANNAYYYNGYCYAICPFNTYPNATTMICLSCSYQCLSCVGPSGQECTQCNTPYSLASNNNTYGECISSCLNLSYYYDILSSSCIKCDLSCSSCINYTETGCTSCAQGYMTLEDNSTGNWSGSCFSNGTVINTINQLSLAELNGKLGLLPAQQHIATYDVIFYLTFSLVTILIGCYLHSTAFEKWGRGEIVDYIIVI